MLHKSKEIRGKERLSHFIPKNKWESFLSAISQFFILFISMLSLIGANVFLLLSSYFLFTGDFTKSLMCAILTVLNVYVNKA